MALQSGSGAVQPHLDDAGAVWRVAVRVLQLGLCDEHVQVCRVVVVWLWSHRVCRSLLQSNPTPSLQQIEDLFDGNICRCTGMCCE